MTDDELKALHKRLTALNRRSRSMAQAEVATLCSIDLARMVKIEWDRRMRVASTVSPIRLLCSLLLAASGIAQLVVKSHSVVLIQSVAIVVYGFCILVSLSAGPKRPSRDCLASALENAHNIEALPAALALLGMGQIRKNFT